MLFTPPTSVGFAAHASHGLRAAKWPCSPKTSLVALATHGFTHGRSTGQGHRCPLRVLTSFEHVLRSDNLSPTAKGKQGGCLPSFPSRQPLPPPDSQLRGWIVSVSNRGDSSTPDTRRDPRPPRRLRRASAPTHFACTDQPCWTQRPEEHTGGCRLLFSSWTLFIHPQRGYANAHLVCAGHVP